MNPPPITSEPMPTRITLSRRKGWRMPPNTVKVCRPGKWGNPFKSEQFRWTKPDPETDISPRRRTDEECQAEAVAAYEAWLPPEIIEAARRELRGKNLACWCQPGTPCHANVLLRLANDYTTPAPKVGSSAIGRLPNDMARCNGVGSDADGWREGCDTCLRRVAPRKGKFSMIGPPLIIAFQCEYLIEPNA